MIDRFLPFLVTTQDAQLLFQELMAVRKTEYIVGSDDRGGVPSKIETVLNTHIRFDIAQTLRKEFTRSPQTFYRQVDDTMKSVSHLPVVELTLAYQPTWKQLAELHKWFVHYFQQPVLVKSRFLPSLIAGVEVAWQGHFFDLSLKKDLENTAIRKWKVAT